MTSAAEALFVVGIGIWVVCSVLRFVAMYDSAAPLQKWRRWDVFHLVPVGAFFSPNPPPTEFCILVRDFLHDEAVTAWTEVPRIRGRRWVDFAWAPKKHIYRAKLDVVRNLLSTAAHLSGGPGELPPSLVVSDPYIALLRFASSLPRVSTPRATQFAVVETDLLAGTIIRAVVSSVHRV
jgi:hypothetical protein